MDALTSGTSRLQHTIDGESLVSWGFLTWILWLDFLPLSPLVGHRERGPKKKESWRGQLRDECGGVQKRQEFYSLASLRGGVVVEVVCVCVCVSSTIVHT